MVRGVLMAGARADVTGPLNLGSDQEITIAELSRLIVELSGLDVEIVLDQSKPDGHPRRAPDTRRARAELGFEAVTPLREGLAKTLEWYLRVKERVAV
jgi:nucleoside-diphosphate-sugar epimerase